MNGAHVLFVEDEEALRAIVRDALAGLGFQLTLAGDGVHAMELLREGPGFSHIVTDVSMPGDVSGIELANEVLQRQPPPRVVITSGYQRSQLPPLPARAHFLPKPYRIRQLLQALDIEPAPASAEGAGA